ncbi:hypothetical protein DPMN_166141 [Dreissena polymorpha]|uniref:Uncharacterized protein n=1 Tax=Dreissena polymorpha TaxID=45954 RepID=A0A9D4IXM2_DREPO|nr:hypothetical protein DPMN_166141 [Dreissena polymorpha]
MTMSHCIADDFSNLFTLQPTRNKHNPWSHHSQNHRRPRHVFTRRIAQALNINPRNNAESEFKRPGHTARTLLERSLNGMKRGRISATLVTAHKMEEKNRKHGCCQSGSPLKPALV